MITTGIYRQLGMVRHDGFRVEIHHWQEEIPLADGECFYSNPFHRE